MDPFLGEIRPVPFNFAPQGWAQCNGQLLSIAQNSALFSLIGTEFGGDGRTTFALPNLQGNVPLGAGQGIGLSPYVVGQAAGSASVALTPGQLPAHVHAASAGTAGANEYSPAGGVPGVAAREVYSSTAALNTTLPAVQASGGTQPHNNMQPFLTVTFIIALQGIFPTRP